MREAPSSKGGRRQPPDSNQDSGVRLSPDRVPSVDPRIKALAAPLGEWAQPYIGKIPDAALRRLNVSEEHGGYSPEARQEMLDGWEAGTFSFAKSERKRSQLVEDEEMTRDLTSRIDDYSEDKTGVSSDALTRTLLDEKTRVLSVKMPKGEAEVKQRTSLRKKENASAESTPQGRTVLLPKKLPNFPGSPSYRPEQGSRLQKERRAAFKEALPRGLPKMPENKKVVIKGEGEGPGDAFLNRYSLEVPLPSTVRKSVPPPVPEKKPESRVQRLFGFVKNFFTSDKKAA